MSADERTVLIVEDSPTMRSLLVYAMERIPGVVTVEADNGVAALATLAELRPDVVLCDINMPVMDGLKLLKRIREDERLSDVPVVVITTEGGDEDRERALALGATEFVSKPIKAPQIVDIVSALLTPPPQ